MRALLSNTKTVTMRYRSIVTFVPSTVAAGYLNCKDVNGNQGVFRINNPYDPQYAALTGSDYNLSAETYNFWAGLYTHYNVEKTTGKFTFRFVNDQALANTGAVGPFLPPLIVGCDLDDEGTRPITTNWLQQTIMPTTKFKKIWATEKQKATTLKMVWNAKDWTGQDRDALAGSFATASSPAEQQYWRLWYAWGVSPIAIANYPGMVVDVEIKMRVKMTEPRDVMSMVLPTVNLGAAMAES